MGYRLRDSRFQFGEVIWVEFRVPIASGFVVRNVLLIFVCEGVELGGFSVRFGRPGRFLQVGGGP